VSLVVPAKVDSKLARLASEPHKGQLLEAGVRIYNFHGGLLHTKSVTVDGVRSLFGSLNLDPRSMVLNFEITLAIYDAPFTEALRGLQESYIAQSSEMTLTSWHDRAPAKRFAEDAARLLSPLL
jgi:cardiolipin synthase